MALDSKQKRGSAVHTKLPFRRWLSNPAGDLTASTGRLSILKLCSAVAATVTVLAVDGIALGVARGAFVATANRATVGEANRATVGEATPNV